MRSEEGKDSEQYPLETSNWRSLEYGTSGRGPGRNPGCRRFESCLHRLIHKRPEAEVADADECEKRQSWKIIPRMKMKGLHAGSNPARVDVKIDVMASLDTRRG